MIEIEKVRDLALAFEDTVELPHFELTSFRVNKKIFAALDAEKNRVMIKLSLLEQSLFVDNKAVFPVPNVWGAKGELILIWKKLKKVFSKML